MRDLRPILLVEDSPKDAELTLAALSRCQLLNDVIHVRDGAEALDYLRCEGKFAGANHGGPVVVLLEIRGYKHFVVMQRADKDWVYIGDPVLGHKRYAKDDFVKGWNGIVFAVLGEGYDKTNVLLDPPTPLTAKNRINEFSPVRDSELMDFGFIQSDFF